MLGKPREFIPRLKRPSRIPMSPLLRFSFVLFFFFTCIRFSESGMWAVAEESSEGGRRKEIEKVSGEDEDQSEKAMVVLADKVRILLGLERLHKMKRRRGVRDFEQGPSSSPSPAPLPPAPHPMLHRHKHSHPSSPHVSLLPPSHDSLAQGSDRGNERRVTKIVVAVVVSVGGTFAIAGLISILLCRKFRRTRKRRSRPMNIPSTVSNKVSFDPGPDIFYLDSMAPISSQASLVKPPLETVSMVVKGIPMSSSSALYEMGESSGETAEPEKGGCSCSSVEESGLPVESPSSDDESFHSLCNSRSSNARVSDASEPRLSHHSGTSSPSFCSRRFSSPERTFEGDASSPPVIPPVTPDIPPPEASYLRSSCSSPVSPNPEQWHSTTRHESRVSSFDESQLSGTSTDTQIANLLPSVLSSSNSQAFEMEVLEPALSRSSPERVPATTTTTSPVFPCLESSTPEKTSSRSRNSQTLPKSSLASSSTSPTPCPPPPPPPLPPLLAQSSQKKGNSFPQTPRAPANIPPPPCPPLSPFLPTAFSKGGKAAGVPPPPPPSLPPLFTPIGKDGAPLPKLKPLHWDKVRATPDRSMVWDKLRSSSFEFDEQMIESLFGYNLPSSTKNEELRSKSPSPITHILEPKRLQNITILSKALNASVSQVCDALIRGDGLCSQQLEALAKMVLTKEEEDKLSNFGGDINELGDAERFVKEILSVPFAFQRIDAMLYRDNFEDEVVHLRGSFAMLAEACTELRSSRLFLRLLEAVLKTGNRMNVGTIRGGAKAFKLDALLKLADVKGTDGKTTLLHFVVQEMVRSEGIRESEINAEKNKNHRAKPKNAEEREEDYRALGLELVSGLSTELCNVKKTATIDLDVLASSVSNLWDGMVKLRGLVTDSLATNGSDDDFVHSMTSFLNHAEKNIKALKEDEDRVLLHVRDITEYFHGDLSRDEGNPLRIFVIVRDFLGLLDRVCKEVRIQKAQNATNSPVPFR